MEDEVNYAVCEKVCRKLEIITGWYDDMTDGEYKVTYQNALKLLVMLEEAKK